MENDIRKSDSTMFEIDKKVACSFFTSYRRVGCFPSPQSVSFYPEEMGKS